VQKSPNSTWSESGKAQWWARTYEVW